MKGTDTMLADWQITAIQETVATHQARPGALLPILHGIQEALGWVPAESVPVIAAALNLSRAEVHGVIGFYPHFRGAPPGRRVLQICRAESCQAMGAEALAAHAVSRLGIDFHQTTADGELTLEPVYCLGNCACSPAIRIGDEIHGRISCARLDTLLDEARRPAGEAS